MSEANIKYHIDINIHSNLLPCIMQDSLDSAEFDPIEFINNSFPTEMSLENLDTFVFGVSSQITTLDEEISLAVQSQSVAGQQASKVLTIVFVP